MKNKADIVKLKTLNEDFYREIERKVEYGIISKVEHSLNIEAWGNIGANIFHHIYRKLKQESK